MNINLISSIHDHRFLKDGELISKKSIIKEIKSGYFPAKLKLFVVFTFAEFEMFAKKIYQFYLHFLKLKIERIPIILFFQRVS